MQGRHGDLLLVSVESLPPGAVLTAEGKVAILAVGEVTGHSHTLTATAGKVMMWDVERQDYVTVEGPGELTHQEHGTITVAPGVYKIIHQQELDLSGEWKRVVD